MFKNKIILLTLLIVILLAAVLGAKALMKPGDEESSEATFTVKRGPLVISFTESGTIKAREQTIIKNEVEGRTSIISLIPEGTRVNKGDLLIELDASSLVDSKIDQEIRVQNAEAAYIGAKEDLAVTENKAKSDVSLAQLNLEFAKQDLEKYIDGEYPNKLDEAEAEITRLEEELVRAQETLKWSRKLFDEKYIPQTELQGDEIAEKKLTLELKLAKNKKRLLTEYTYQRDLAQLQSDVEQAEMALERETRRAKADVIQAEATLTAKEAEFTRQKDKLQKIIDQLGKTKLYAPTGGLVIYATSAQSGGWRGSTEPLDEGQEVRERQELIYLPAGNASNAEISLHESNLKKARVGLPAVITVNTLPGRTFYGTVSRIAPLPDAQSIWMNPDLKVYNTIVQIEGSDEALRTGMSCQVEIIVARYDDAVYIPIQTVTRVNGQPTVYVKDKGVVSPRKVSVGLDNNKMIHITEGLRKGEVILMNPPLAPAAKEGPDLNGSENGGDIDAKINRALEGLPEASAEQLTLPEKESGISEEQVPEQLKNIDPAKLEEMRKQFENMSPEEKEKLREKMRQGRRQDRSSQAETSAGASGDQTP